MDFRCRNFRTPLVTKSQGFMRYEFEVPYYKLDIQVEIADREFFDREPIQIRNLIFSLILLALDGPCGSVTVAEKI